MTRRSRSSARGRWLLVPVLMLVLPFLSTGAQAQEEAMDPELAPIAQEFARLWAAGQAESLGPLLARDGIRLHLDGPARSATPPRQAMAAVRDFLRGFEERTAQVTRAAVAGGTEDRGFVELAWSARRTGTSQWVEYTLFLSMARLDGHWRVEEIRLLP
ncbi:MAG: hypothetical protein EA351_14055 [Gemmatimonadales bacterium]|nr:MAG: hypothetical protein EA351_14055 [Gemmatimonadales bacterium]